MLDFGAGACESTCRLPRSGIASDALRHVLPRLSLHRAGANGRSDYLQERPAKCDRWNEYHLYSDSSQSSRPSGFRASHAYRCAAAGNFIRFGDTLMQLGVARLLESALLEPSLARQV